MYFDPTSSRGDKNVCVFPEWHSFERPKESKARLVKQEPNEGAADAYGVVKCGQGWS